MLLAHINASIFPRFSGRLKSRPLTSLRGVQCPLCPPLAVSSAVPCYPITLLSPAVVAFAVVLALLSAALIAAPTYRLAKILSSTLSSTISSRIPHIAHHGKQCQFGGARTLDTDLTPLVVELRYHDNRFFPACAWRGPPAQGFYHDLDTFLFWSNYPPLYHQL